MDILGKNRLHNLGFYVPKSGLTVQQATILNRVEQELPSMSDVAKADNIELQEIMENATRSTGNLITQSDTRRIHWVTHLNILCASIWAWTKS